MKKTQYLLHANITSFTVYEKKTDLKGKMKSPPE